MRDVLCEKRKKFILLVFTVVTFVQLMIRKNIINSKTEKKYSGTQDKGHRAEVASFLDSIKNGKPAPLAFDEIYLTSLATFKVLESISMNGTAVRIEF